VFPEKGFADIAAARQWVAAFVVWYNTEHRHSGIHFVTPEQRHQGRDVAILAQRMVLYESARARHPERWSCGTRQWKRCAVVHLNRPKDDENVSNAG
jgi:putative transposase